ncbi:type IV secretion system protein [Myxococcus llanfairpwllgwyngyllgogerychwyrndrobwllllantysiliogogogochensis]|uniref:Type IV secretion system protein n=1 Tax=Myxococcus llanfairpwllgwyngyllgogerychwyrndrobwllllantysiliogogogochensis TaxID=2590453 RepID=A0A540WWP8_9BACT|nr:conjugal transfer protein TrbF [Myxococcus llanfairpwllgwyngyllgogerychwyrndrobwllllantysiliogogogochensis]TQF13429.1 type IV secretion system protein [Myxococcus llanfairpwllgwyngyllgogerychwyrndrobwllllantysiliogogogochensis]
MAQPPPNYAPSGPIDTPFKRAAKEWDDRIGNARVQAANWRHATFGAIAIALVAVAGVIYLGSRPRFVPHIIEVDQVGAAAYRGPVGTAVEQYKPTDAVIKFHLRRFLAAIRGISADTAVVKRNWEEAWLLASRTAQVALTQYARENNPIARSAKERVTVEVKSMVQVSNGTWQVDWRETTWDERGNPRDEVLWRGMFTVAQHPVESEMQLAVNPLGLLVEEFHWDRLK